MRKIFLLALVPIALCFWANCAARIEPYIAIKAGPDFFVNRSMGVSRSGKEYFRATWRGHNIFLLPDPKKKLTISSSMAYFNLDSLQIRKSGDMASYIEIYYIEKLIYAKEDTIKTK
jgi:hypothetical protein